MNKRIINVAVVAHVDAGKSTLVDALLEQSGTFGDREERIEQVMDSDDLERERGITIYSKNASIDYKGVKINIIDTPGHADFSGEVERIIKNVDTVILLVDSSEGPMPQTRFVLNKSLEQGLKPILLINKIDKPEQRSEAVVDMVLELFMELGATDEQLEFPVLYGAARDGVVKHTLDGASTTLEPLFEVLMKHIPAYPYTTEDNLQLQISSLKYDNFLGRIGVGRLISGSLTKKGKYTLINQEGTSKIVGFSKLFTNKGLGREEVEVVQPGDMVSVAGVADITIGDTITSLDNPVAMEPIIIEEPTISMEFLVNKSPLNGQEGKHVTLRKIEERLRKELETNVALRISPLKDTLDEGFKVEGRGELHLSILIENMRRNDFELAVSKPKVIFKEVNGKRHEPFEDVQVTCDDEFSGAVIQQISERKGIMTNMTNHNDQTMIEFLVPTRGLIGYRQTFITSTRGTGILEKTFNKYDAYAGEIKGRKNGVLVSTEAGKAMPYSLWKISERGELLIEAGTTIYEGMIIGIHSKADDLDVNPAKNKQMTNVRSSGTDESVKIQKPKLLSLEEALEFIAVDELVEVTPQSIRLRKKTLDKRYRKNDAFS